MKTFKSFIIEETSSHTPINSNDIEDFFNSINIQKYKHAINYIIDSGGTKYIYRGIRSEKYKNFLEATPNNSIRRSANEKTNIYTLLASDILESWRNFPKRSKSVICSTNLYTAKSYGDGYVVIPQNNAVFGVCPEDDMWFSFSDETLAQFDIESINNMCMLLLRFFKFCIKTFNVDSLKNIDIDNLDAKSLKHLLIIISQQLDNHKIINGKLTYDLRIILQHGFYHSSETIAYNEIEKFQRILDMFFVYHKGNKIDLLNCLDVILDPFRNNFQLIGFADIMDMLNVGDYRDNEVWTNADVLLIKEYYLTDFLDYYKNHNL